MGKIYFASDFHLGIDVKYKSREREKQLIAWLDLIKADAEEIYLVGDLFDFWFEYKRVVPKGYIRILGKLAELSDSGIKLFFFTGNHDMWMFDYFTNELNIPILRNPIEKTLKGKKFYIGHGDGLGPGDYSYKFLKTFFSSKLCQWLFARLHPNFGIGLANLCSGSSRKYNNTDDVFNGPEKEWLILFCQEHLKHNKVDFFVFGHRHLPIDFQFQKENARYINLGDWMNHNSYAVFDGEKLSLEFYKNPDGKIISGTL